MRRPWTTAFLVLNATWTLLVFAAPVQAPTASLRGLDGAVNLVDHADRWTQLPQPAAFVYAAGDLTCHQMEARSGFVNGNQIPLADRMLALFVAGNVGFALALALPPRATARDAVLALFPLRLRDRLRTPRRRLAALAILLVAGMLPTALDGFAQWWTPYESHAALRLLGGAWLGLLGSLWLGLVYDALHEPRRDAPETATTRQGSSS